MVYNTQRYWVFGLCPSSENSISLCDRMRVFENRVLRRIFEPKKNEVTGDRRKLHNEELHNLYSSQSIIRMTNSRRMR
jgi:hypothetical protein